MVSYALLIAVCAWAIAQLIKVLIVLTKEKRLSLRYFASSGGMPSSHSATVSALATAVGMTEGFDSAAFAIAAILAIVVMYDAAGVRRTVGQQSFILNRIVKELLEKRPKDELERDLLELIGHTLFQVIVGSILGIFIAWLWLFISALQAA